jgi:hypothetical protein
VPLRTARCFKAPQHSAVKLKSAILHSTWRSVNQSTRSVAQHSALFLSATDEHSYCFSTAQHTLTHNST